MDLIMSEWIMSLLEGNYFFESYTFIVCKYTAEYLQSFKGQTLQVMFSMKIKQKE